MQQAESPQQVGRVSPYRLLDSPAPDRLRRVSLPRRHAYLWHPGATAGCADLDPRGAPSGTGRCLLQSGYVQSC